MQAHWLQEPPVELLVRAFVGYEPPAREDRDEPADGDDVPPPWIALGMGGIPAPDAARNATSSAEAFAAFERMFFGEVIDGRQIRRQ